MLVTATLSFSTTALASETAARASLPSSTAAATSDLRGQFTPAKDDDDGSDYAESQELLYQWMNPKYAADERRQLSGIAAYFLVLCGGFCYARIAARRRLKPAR